MDTILDLAESLSVRLHAGAVGSLLGVVIMPAGREAGALKQMFCSWVFAVFGTPLAIAIAKASPVASEIVKEIPSDELESVGAFATGLLGWKLLTAIRNKTRRM